MNQIEKIWTWELVSRPKYINVIGTKLVLINKMNENGHVVRNKEIIVFIGSAQDKGIYFQESFSPISTLESIKKI